MEGDVSIDCQNHVVDLGYLLAAAAYLVFEDAVLLVHHNGFERWVPPGGHLEPDETFAGAAERECLEETGIEVVCLSAGPMIHPPDDNATPEPVPFYVDLLREQFRKPCLMQYFFVDTRDAIRPEPVAERREVSAARFFTLDEIVEIETFDQVRSLAAWVIQNHPRSKARGGA